MRRRRQRVTALGKVSFGRTSLDTEQDSMTAVRFSGKSVGRIISRIKPGGMVEYEVQIENEPNIQTTTLSSAKALARNLLASK
jgi:hypothetical protein